MQKLGLAAAAEAISSWGLGLEMPWRGVDQFSRFRP